VLVGKPLYEVIHGKVSSYEHLRAFGSLSYVHNQSKTKDKFDSRSRKCVFVGYPFGQNGWKLLDLEKVFLVSHDIHFIEEVFPFQEAQTTKPQVAQSGFLVLEIIFEGNIPIGLISNASTGEPNSPILNETLDHSFTVPSIEEKGEGMSFQYNPKKSLSMHLKPELKKRNRVLLCH